MSTLTLLELDKPVHLEAQPNRPALTLTSNPIKEIEDIEGPSVNLQLNFIFDGITWIPGPECPTGKAQPTIKNKNVLTLQIFHIHKIP